MIRLKRYNKEEQKGFKAKGYRQTNKKRMSANLMETAPKIKIENNQSK